MPLASSGLRRASRPSTSITAAAAWASIDEPRLKGEVVALRRSLLTQVTDYGDTDLRNADPLPRPDGYPASLGRGGPAASASSMRQRRRKASHGAVRTRRGDDGAKRHRQRGDASHSGKQTVDPGSGRVARLACACPAQASEMLQKRTGVYPGNADPGPHQRGMWKSCAVRCGWSGLTGHRKYDQHRQGATYSRLESESTSSRTTRISVRQGPHRYRASLICGSSRAVREVSCSGAGAFDFEIEGECLRKARNVEDLFFFMGGSINRSLAIKLVL